MVGVGEWERDKTDDSPQDALRQRRKTDDGEQENGEFRIKDLEFRPFDCAQGKLYSLRTSVLLQFQILFDGVRSMKSKDFP